MSLVGASGELRGWTPGDARQDSVNNQQHTEGNTEYQQPGKKMEKSLGFVGTPVFAKDAASHDAKCVRENCDGYRGYNDEEAPHGLGFEEISVNSRYCQ